MNFDYELLDEKDVPEGMVLPEEGWAIKVGDAVVCINFVKFGEKENPDGTMDVDINYELMEGVLPKGFDNAIGDMVISMLEDSFTIKETKALMKEAKEAREANAD